MSVSRHRVALSPFRNDPELAGAPPRGARSSQLKIGNGIRVAGAILMLAAARTHADLIETADRRTVEGRVTAVAEDGLHLAAGTTVAWPDVRRVVFDRPATHASEERLLLRDGTAVCGAVRRLTRERIAFRAVIAGELDLPLDQVAAVQLGDAGGLDHVDGASASNVVVMLKSGLVRSGTLVAASANNVLLKTADGLEKSAFDSLSGVAFGPVPAADGPAVVLRNGDRLCGAAQWTGAEIRTAVAGAPVALALETVAEIRR